MTSALVALASVVLAALIAVAAYAGTAALAGALALTVVGVALGWGVLLRLPDLRGTMAAIAVSGWAATGVAVITAGTTQPLAAFASLLAGSVLLAFVHELLRGDGRGSLVESVTGTLSGQVVAVLGAGWVLLPGTRLGATGVLVAAVAAAATAVTMAAPLASDLRGWVAFGAGTGAGGVAAIVAEPGRLATSLILGLAVSAVVAGMGRLLASQPTARTPLGLLAAASAPVCAVGTVAYAVARLAGS